MNLELSKKNVLITGASRGIGASIAEGFLKEGANVLIVSRGSQQLYDFKDKMLDDYPNSEVYAEACDCTSVDDLSVLKVKVEKLFGKLDILVSNIGDGRSVLDVIPDDEQWIKTWSSNFESSLYTTRTFLPMLEDSNGCLLFVSSIVAKEAFGAPVDYSTAKAAVTAFSKNIARKLADSVRVNTVLPGNILFNDSSWDIKYKKNPKEVDKNIKSTVPMNRFGSPDEIADIAVFLCSNRASFITGSAIVVDGGQTVSIF